MSMPAKVYTPGVMSTASVLGNSIRKDTKAPLLRWADMEPKRVHFREGANKVHYFSPTDGNPMAVHPEVYTPPVTSEVSVPRRSIRKDTKPPALRWADMEPKRVHFREIANKVHFYASDASAEKTPVCNGVGSSSGVDTTTSAGDDSQTDGCIHDTRRSQRAHCRVRPRRSRPCRVRIRRRVSGWSQAEQLDCPARGVIEDAAGTDGCLQSGSSGVFCNLFRCWCLVLRIIQQS
eukprot:Filipodium_phascolosomae@DN2495_c0_g1_i1.p1